MVDCPLNTIGTAAMTSMSGGVAAMFFTVSYSPPSEFFSTWSLTTPVPAKIHESG